MSAAPPSPGAPAAPLADTSSSSLPAPPASPSTSKAQAGSSGSGSGSARLKLLFGLCMLALIGVLLATLIERGVERDETAGRGHGGLDLDTKQSRRLGRPQRVAAPPRKKAVEEEDEEELLEDLEEMADRQNDDDDAAETATAQPEEATSDEEEQRLEKEEQIIEQLELKELEKAQKEAKKKSKKTEEDKDFHFNSLPAPKKVVRMWSDHNMTQDGLYPKVIGIGCQKCGTSSLSVYIENMKYFVMSNAKELHYFNGDWETRTFDRLLSNANWYSQKWSKHGLKMECDGQTRHCTGNAAPDVVPFEITPRYICDLRVPYNMQASLPHVNEVKLIAILRLPTPRTWSAFFQSTWQRNWNNETYIKVVEEEVEILRKCYNATMAMTLMSPIGKTGHTYTDRCRDPLAMYRELQRCANHYRRDANHPWFFRFTLDGSSLGTADVGAVGMYEGIVMRGFYADQLLNYLCAGFRPEQILVLTNSELRYNPMETLDRVAKFSGFAFEHRSEKWWSKWGVKGLQKKSKSTGPQPKAMEKLLDELFEPHNRILYDLLSSMNFVVDLKAIQKEFKL